MKIAFLSGAVLGVALALAIAGFYPWVDHVRMLSYTGVQQNGGRTERFVIRLPADQIIATGTQDGGVRNSAALGGVRLPEALSQAAVRLEHFKVRDIEGNVIGLAAKHTTAVPAGPNAAWAITIPSRGTLRLVGTDAFSDLDDALERAGRREALRWSGDVSSTPSRAEGGVGRAAGSSGEFEGLAGSYAESWRVTGVDEIGGLRGTIPLATTLFRAP